MQPVEIDAMVERITAQPVYHLIGFWIGTTYATFDPTPEGGYDIAVYRTTGVSVGVNRPLSRVRAVLDEIEAEEAQHAHPA